MNVLKLIIVVAISTLISSCGFYVTADEWAKCEKICENNGGIDNYQNGDLFSDKCFCKNGVSIYIYEIGGEI